MFLLDSITLSSSSSMLLSVTLDMSRLVMSTVGADITRTSNSSLPGFSRFFLTTSSKFNSGHLALLSDLELYARVDLILHFLDFSMLLRFPV